jgi:predicted ester cyclase
MEEVLNQRKVDVADEIVADDCVDHFHPAPARVFVPFLVAAFPDLHFATEDLFAGEDDRVVVRFTMTATHEGDFAGIAATGKKISLEGIAVMRVVDGKIVEFWEKADDLVPQLTG